ncbi:hypothetical protein [Pararhodobacter zhoushanensis]|uniref:Uncharacterized protein n=1 Tax=Pararhodobacter zhoushanensis TaxID=2479545 RepID=A0ABT3GXR2_9RHOB|nr:hypothetical protein [Pararhodobacter zhoushanensis]MCW1932312.1 hypothetical protein [Pararhodobacter zhoushanensis]
MIRRVQPLDRPDWLLITDPAEGIPVATVDMLIPAEEVHAFEDEHEMVRRVAGGQVSASPYDWDGMTIARIQRIHDHGLPVTQSELVAEMQDWFAERSDGAKMPDGRSIRRRITPVWRALKEGEA